MDGVLTLEELEKKHVLETLDRTSGNVARAARALDVDRRTLYRKLEKWGWSRVGAEHVELVSEVG
jgi:transcriptional regulator of acetoin/glycerol metabolism